MQIFVQTLTKERVFALYVDPTDSIHDVKLKIQRLKGVSYCQIRLNFCGRDMYNNRTLSHYGVNQYSTIKLFLRVRLH